MRLAELAVVTIIISSLTCIAAPAMMENIEFAQTVVLAHNVKALQQAVDIYRIEYGEYPKDLSDLIRSGYFRVLPPNPFTGEIDYKYSAATGTVTASQLSTDYHIGS